jgi:RNA polymerase sigma factor (sigma-70 family)
MQSSLQRPVLAEPLAALPAVHAVPVPATAAAPHPPQPPAGADAAAVLLARVDERTLCDRALHGDTEAWNALVHKHNHRVVVSLLARGVRIDRAKDIAQETWMRLIEQQRAGRLTQLVLPGLAVAQAAFFSLENARRESSRHEPLPIDAVREATDLVDPAADAETRLVTGERLERAEQVLARCSASARAVFQLAYGGEGLGHAEIAERVGLSLQRVRQILCEVRKELRTALEGDGHE